MRAWGVSLLDAFRPSDVHSDLNAKDPPAPSYLVAAGVLRYRRASESATSGYLIDGLCRAGAQTACKGPRRRSARPPTPGQIALWGHLAGPAEVRPNRPEVEARVG